MKYPTSDVQESKLSVHTNIIIIIITTKYLHETEGLLGHERRNSVGGETYQIFRLNILLHLQEKIVSVVNQHSLQIN